MLHTTSWCTCVCDNASICVYVHVCMHVCAGLYVFKPPPHTHTHVCSTRHATPQKMPVTFIHSVLTASFTLHWTVPYDRNEPQAFLQYVMKFIWHSSQHTELTVIFIFPHVELATSLHVSTGNYSNAYLLTPLLRVSLYKPLHAGIARQETFKCPSSLILYFNTSFCMISHCNGCSLYIDRLRVGWLKNCGWIHSRDERFFVFSKESRPALRPT